jgi:hypothetical protein
MRKQLPQRRAFLITGFNGWGKSTLIRKLFPKNTNFKKGKVYYIAGISKPFAVESQSNDDLHGNKYIDKIRPKVQGNEDFISAFCPTAEPENDSATILKDQVFRSFDEIILILLKYRWDGHAELRIPQIKSHLASVKKLQIWVVNDKDPTKWPNKINRFLFKLS